MVVSIHRHSHGGHAGTPGPPVARLNASLSLQLTGQGSSWSVAHRSRDRMACLAFAFVGTLTAAAVPNVTRFL